ncbi:hypothetical protein, partial [Desulfosporosinus sp. Sb-LF]|uniref:hypothetical protein n=1 Tax=Desulfosporosinus sp. Sb-LF TaxID=2560027 RepID=UPI001A7ED2C7
NFCIEEDDDLLIVSLKLLRVSLIGCPCCLVFKDHGLNFVSSTRLGRNHILAFSTRVVNH